MIAAWLAVLARLGLEPACAASPASPRAAAGSHGQQALPRDGQKTPTSTKRETATSTEIAEVTKNLDLFLNMEMIEDLDLVETDGES